jgi:hypothetical protein
VYSVRYLSFVKFAAVEVAAEVPPQYIWPETLRLHCQFIVKSWVLGQLRDELGHRIAVQF